MAIKTPHGTCLFQIPPQKFRRLIFYLGIAAERSQDTERFCEIQDFLDKLSDTVAVIPNNGDYLLEIKEACFHDMIFYLGFAARKRDKQSFTDIKQFIVYLTDDCKPEPKG